MSDMGYTPRLKRVGTETLEFGVYDIEMDDETRDRFRADPVAFLREVITADTDFGINSIIVDSELLKPDGGSGTTPVPQVYHCEAPPQYVSKWITIVL